MAFTPLVADIVTLVNLATDLVVTVKGALVLPADIVTLAGTVATAVELLERVTTALPDGAGPVKVTVPVEDVPPSTEVGFKLTELRAAAVTVRVAVFVTPWVPEIVTEALDATADVVIVKVAVVAPAATVTFGGTCAAAVLLPVRVTTEPPDGAGPVKVTVPVEDVPQSLRRDSN